jgi:hypothetical protein
LLTCTWNITTIDAPFLGSAGYYASLKFNSQNRPHIAYHDSQGHLRYARSVTSGGNCGPGNSWSCQEIDSTSPSTHSAALIVQRGSPDSPMIAYADGYNGRLKLADYVIMNGNCGPLHPVFTSSHTWRCRYLDRLNAPTGAHPISIAQQKQDFWITYVDLPEGQAPERLRIAFSGTSSALGNCGPNWDWVCGTLDGGGSWVEVSPFVSMVIDSDGRPMVVYSETDSYYNVERVKFSRLLAHLFLPLVRK